MDFPNNYIDNKAFWFVSAAAAYYVATSLYKSINTPHVLAGARPTGPSTRKVAQELENALPGLVHSRKDAELLRSIASYYCRFAQSVRPGFIVKPTTADEVATAVKILSKAAQDSGPDDPVRFAVRSGGHNISQGFASVEGGVVLDLRSLNQIELSPDKSILTVQPGATWNDVYRYLEPHGLAVAGGRAPKVGVGGLIVGGGLSFYSPTVGFTCDTVTSFELVLADGTIITADDTTHQDLTIALRGGGNNFGIVTQFTMRTFAQPQLWAGWTHHYPSTGPQILRGVYDFVLDTDKSATIIAVIPYIEWLRHTIPTMSIHYTLPTPKPKALQPFTSTPQLWNTLKIRSLPSIVNSVGDPRSNPPDKHNIWMTTTVYNDLDLLNYMYATHQALIPRIRKAVPSLSSFCLVLHPLVPSATANHAHNAMGIAPGRNSTTNEPLVIVLLTLIAGTPMGWDGRETVALLQEMIDGIEAKAKETGKWHPYKYMNYAHASQDVFGGYGEARKEFLQNVSRKYDQHGIWQWAVPGGHKLFGDTRQHETGTLIE